MEVYLNTAIGILANIVKSKTWTMRSRALAAHGGGGPGARLRAPGGVQGQRPGGGRGGEAPRSSRAFTH